MSFFSERMMKTKVVTVKTLMKQLLKNNYPLHCSQIYENIRLLLQYFKSSGLFRIMQSNVNFGCKTTWHILW